jgi:hypothetical protein
MGYKRSIILFLFLAFGLFTPAYGEHEVSLKTVRLERDIGIEEVKSGSDRLKKDRAKVRHFESNFNEQNSLEISQLKNRSFKEDFLHLHLGSIRFQVKSNGEWIR